MAKRSITGLVLTLAVGAVSAQQYGIQPIQPFQPIMPFSGAPPVSAPRTYFGADGSITTIREIPRSTWTQPRSFGYTEIPGHGFNDGRFNSRSRIFTEPDANPYNSNWWGWNQ